LGILWGFGSGRRSEAASMLETQGPDSFRNAANEELKKWYLFAPARLYCRDIEVKIN
jgi:hypothetical protein